MSLKSYAMRSLLLAGILVTGCARENTEVILNKVQMTVTREASTSDISNIYTRAECNGPGGAFQTQVWSATEGFTRFEQRSSRDTTVAGIGTSRSWIMDENGVSGMDTQNEAFLQGHELHMIAYNPLSRFSEPAYMGHNTFDEKESIQIQFRDRLNNPVDIYYHPSEYYPFGMEIQNPFSNETDKIRILFRDWQQLDNGLFFFTGASFHQGENVWTYRYTTIETDMFDNTVFEPEHGL